VDIDDAEADAPTGYLGIDRHERVALLKSLLKAQPTDLRLMKSSASSTPI
jgi:hypothetical protein